jgi:hypothetical protein
MGVLEVMVLVVVLALEVGLLWAAAAVGDAPPLSWPKLLGLALGVGAICLGGAIAISWGMGLFAESTGNWWLQFFLALALALVLWLVLPALVYPPVFPVSFGRGMVISVVQVLLRLFLWVLLGAVIFVVLAWLQIAKRA